MSRTKNLAAFAANLKYEDLPQNVIDAAKRMILDSIGCGVATPVWEPEKRDYAWKMIELYGGKEEATILGGKKTSAILAAFANSALCHGIDYDDTHIDSVVHAGAPITAAALAAAEATNASTKNLIVAAVVGFEVSTRIASAVMKEHYTYWQTTATCATMGAAALAAKLYGGDAEAIENAIGIAASSAAGLLAYIERGDYSKSFQVGKTAMNGIMAGASAAFGATGPLDALEMKKGFCRAYCPGAEPKWEQLDQNLGTEYKILKNTPKAYPIIACGHPPVENVLAIYQDNNIGPDDVEEIIHRTYTLQTQGFANYDPQSALAARLSTPFCTAIAAAKGRLDLSCFTEDENGIYDPGVREMLNRVKVVPDERADKMYFEYVPSFMTIRTKDGREFYHETLNPKGHPTNPMSQEELENKFRTLAVPALGEEKAEEFIAACRRMEELACINDLTKYLRQ